MFDKLWRGTKQSITVVVSPLVALMKDQVTSCSSKGLIVGYLRTEPVNALMNQGVLEGQYLLVFMSPEALFTKGMCREMLKEEPYYSNLVAFVVGEAHCVKKIKFFPTTQTVN